MANLEKNVEQQVSNNVSTGVGQNAANRETASTSKQRDTIRPSKRKSEDDLLSDNTELGATPNKTTCQNERQSPSPHLKLHRPRSGVRQQVRLSNSNLAAIMAPPSDANQRGGEADQSSVKRNAAEQSAEARDESGEPTTVRLPQQTEMTTKSATDDNQPRAELHTSNFAPTSNSANAGQHSCIERLHANAVRGTTHGEAQGSEPSAATAKQSNADQDRFGKTSRGTAQHQTKQHGASRNEPAANQLDTAHNNAASNSANLHDTTHKGTTINSDVELRSIIDGLSKSLPKGTPCSKVQVQLPQVDEWVAALHDKLHDVIGWPNLSEMEVVGDYSTYTDLPAKVLAEKLNWLLRSREEALQNIMKWQTSPPTIPGLPHWMVFPRFAQRTDFSKNIQRFNAEFEHKYVAQITIHFIECFRNIQREVDAIVSNRSECIDLLTEEQQTTLHDKQKKTNVRLSQMKSGTAGNRNATSSKNGTTSCITVRTSSNNAASSKNATAASNMIATSSKNATSVNDNVAMDTAAPLAQSDHSVNKSAAQWPGKPNVQRRRRSNSNRRYDNNRYAPSQHNAPQTARPVHNRQFWNSNYYSNYRQRQPYAQPWTHYNLRRLQNGPFRPNYYYRHNSAGQYYNYQPPWRNYYEQRPLSGRYDYDSGGQYQTECRRTATSWQPYGNYQSYGGYCY
jgi:hypothetical protein